MTQPSKKLELAIFAGALVVIAAIWAINGYEDTWLYVTTLVIVIPASWFYWGKKNKGR